MTSAENSISEPPNLKIFCWMIPPDPPPQGIISQATKNVVWIFNKY